ncbi:MAG: ATP-binding protein [Rhodospirillales bacterium]|uniref:AAA ATPase n=1 Tax=Thalassospira xiamenensis M-5 = DSM 17429 TaxID=1123366 RepID=A0AB72UFG8_9PROT|nr:MULTISPECIES: ATP-binding protein [Thalassospira]MBR9780940.1 ATP-binding protein [Rhodospirillales bacterium]AJD52965.1 AAA ATPase [Thalassospira xiamenensis M-5 = DSM 17429]MBC07764.1 ATP-binding protein [Thalassospira sp.]MBR9815529.1 ATP-binding protein [Rhodospirillales bacterium]SIT19680.1 AAA ATPase domain-containing protein [Thalassospira xiamenensis M-5 = DSM 17429]|tara:strand:- start:2267 stop:4753 length:2487 start_codon:yes stop_codon:yes gene_type:complete
MVNEQVAHVLEHDKIATAGAESLQAGATKLLLAGESGCGKTSVATSIFSRLSETHHVLTFFADEERQTQSYYVFHQLKRNDLNARRLSRALEIGREWVYEEVPFAKQLHSLVDLVSSLRQQETLDVIAKEVDDVAEGVINLLSAMSKSRPLLLFVDDLQYLDAQSSRLLLRLLKKGRNWPNQVKILATLNNTAIENHPLPVPQAKLMRELFPQIHVPKCHRDQFGALLQAFGLKSPIATHELNMLYDCSGAHLEIVRTFIEDANLRGISTTSLPIETTDALVTILQRYLTESGFSGSDSETILAAAAICGQNIVAEEVACVSGADLPEVARSIETAMRWKLLEENLGGPRFRHEITRHYFERNHHSDRLRLHATYARCLQKMRPAEFGLHFNHLRKAGLIHDAGVAYCLWTIRSAVMHTVADLPELDWSAPSWQRAQYLGRTLNEILKAIDLYREGQYELARKQLLVIDDAVPDQLMAERDGLMAMCLLQSLEQADRARAATLLEPWRDKLQQASDTWVRLMISLMFAQIQLSQFSEARQLEREVLRRLQKYRLHDEGVRHLLNRFRAASCMLHAHEIALPRTERLIEEMENLPVGERYIENNTYFVALTNASSLELTAGNYEKSAKYAERGLKLRGTAPTSKFQSFVPALSNLLVAHALARPSQIENIVSVYESTGKIKPEDEDNLLYRNNQASVLIMAGRFKQAKEMLTEDYLSMKVMPDCDGYFFFFTTQNLALTEYLTGNLENAISLLDESSEREDDLLPDCISYLVQRTRYIRDIWESNAKLTLSEQNGLLTDKANVKGRIGPCWPFYGRLPLFTPIEIWSLM